MAFHSLFKVLHTSFIQSISEHNHVIWRDRVPVRQNLPSAHLASNHFAPCLCISVDIWHQRYHLIHGLWWLTSYIHTYIHAHVILVSLSPYSNSWSSPTTHLHLWPSSVFISECVCVHVHTTIYDLWSLITVVHGFRDDPLGLISRHWEKQK